MSEEFDFLVKLLQLLSPFAVLAITWRNTELGKRKSEQKQMEKELEEAKRKELYDALHEATETMQRSQQDIEKLTLKIKEIDDRDAELKSTLDSIGKMNKVNGRYTHQLAILVTTLAEGLRDQHLDGNITEAVARYHEFEAKMLGSVVTGDEDVI